MSEQELDALKAAVRSHELTMQRELAPNSPLPIIQKGGPKLAMDSALEFFWAVAGDSANVKAFLGASATVLIAYIRGRGARSVVIKPDGLSVELKGSDDVEKAVKAFNEAKPPTP